MRVPVPAYYFDVCPLIVCTRPHYSGTFAYPVCMCVRTRAGNHHLVIFPFHTSVLISIEGINCHGDEQHVDQTHPCTHTVQLHSTVISHGDVTQNSTCAKNSISWWSMSQDWESIDWKLLIHLKSLLFTQRVSHTTLLQMPRMLLLLEIAALLPGCGSLKTQSEVRGQISSRESCFTLGFTTESANSAPCTAFCRVNMN